MPKAPSACLLIALLLSQAQTAIALDPQKRLTQHQLTQWSVDDGLVQNSVRSIVQTPQGYLLLGTYEGMTLFDGVRFQPFPASSEARLEKNTNFIVRDRQDNLWVGGRDTGLHRFSPPVSSQGAHFHAPAANYRHQAWGVDDGLPSRHITALHVDAMGDIWVGTFAGLARIEDGQLRRISDPIVDQQPITGIHSFEDHLFVATAGAGLFLRSGQQDWKAVHGPDGMLTVNALEAHQGELLVGTNTGVLRFQVDGQWLGDIAEPGAFEGETVSALLSSGSQLFIGTYGRGLVRHSANGFDRLSSDRGLSNAYIQSLLLDSQGVLWIGSSGGLHRLVDAPISSLSTLEGLSHGFVRSVIEDTQGALWVGVDGAEGEEGINRINADGRIDHFGAAQGVPGNAVRAMALDVDARLWIAAYRAGLAFFDSDKQRFLSPDWVSQLPSLRNRALMFDRHGNLWIATDDRGVVRRSAQGEWLHLNRANGFPSDSINAMVEAANGDIWMASYGDGLMRWRGKDQVDHWLESDGLPSNTAMTLHIDGQQRLWIGTDRGLAFVEGDRVVSANPPDAAWSGALFQILDDPHGDRLWVCGNQGIIAIDRQALVDAPDRLPDYRRYDRAEGLRNQQCNGGNQPGAWRLSNGWLWFSTADGLAGTHPPSLNATAELGKVIIESVRVDGQALKVAPAGALVLPSTAGRLEVEFTAPSSAAADRLEFRYRLNGYDRDWNTAGTRRNAQYTRLPAGEYQLQVQARRPNSDWQLAGGSSFDLQRPPRASETTAFALLIAAVLIALAFAAYRFRVRRLRQRARALEQHVQARTQELEATINKLSETRNRLVQAEKLASMTRMLAGISHELNTPLGNAVVVNSRMQELTGSLRRLLDQPQPSRQQASAQISRLDEGLTLMQHGLQQAVELIRRFRDSASPASPLGPEKFDLSEHLHNFASTINARRSMTCQLRVDCPRTLLMHSHPESLREVLSELIENSQQHGRATDVVLTVTEPNATQVSLQYQDNGAGIAEPLRGNIFDPLHQSMSGDQRSGLGMHRVFSLVTGILGGQIELLSDQEGAAFRITLPRRLDGE